MELMKQSLQLFEIDIKQDNFTILWWFLNVYIIITLKKLISDFEKNCRVLLKNARNCRGLKA
jgi:hypothetical protein